MGIELNNFKTAIESNQKWLSVSGEDKTGVVGKATKDKISVSDLTKAKPGDIGKAQDNIYLRSQLLEGIRSTLVSAKMMSERFNPETRQQVTKFHNQAVKTFFENAEKTLFGKLDKTGRYGLGTASQDLDAKTVKSLLATLDGFIQVKATKLLNRDQCSLANVRQRKAIYNLDAKALSTCLNISEKAANKLSLTEVETVARGAYMVCTLESKDMRKTVVVDRQGQLMNGDLGFNAARKTFAMETADWMMGTLDPKCFKDVAPIVDLLNESADALMGTPYVNGPLTDAPETISNLRRMLFAMMPQALPLARQLQPEGELRLSTWWSALQLPGNPPSEGAADAGEGLCMALIEKLRSDYANAVGGLTNQDFESMKDVDSLPGTRSNFIRQNKIAYTGFLLNLTNGLSYEKTLFCMKFHCLPQPQDFIDGMNVHLKYLNDGLMVNGDANAPKSQLQQKVLTSITNEIAVDTRKPGSVFTFHDSDDKQFTCGHDRMDDTQAVCQKMLDKGFTHRQLFAMSQFPNEVGMALTPLVGFEQSEENLRVDMQADPANPEDLIVTYDFECIKNGQVGNQVANATKFDQKLHIQVTIHPDGSMDCDELKLKPIGKNIVNQNNIDNQNNIVNQNNAVDNAPAEAEELVHQDIVELETTPAQERSMFNLDGPLLGQLCGVTGEGAQCLRLTKPTMMADNQTIVCQVQGWNGVETGAKVFILKDGGYCLDANAGQRHYFACLNQHPGNVQKLKADPAFIQSAFDGDPIVDSFGPVEAAELTYLESLVDYDMNPAWSQSCMAIKACLVNMLPAVMDKLRAVGQPTGRPETHLAALWTALGLNGDAPEANDPELKHKFTLALATRVCGDIVTMLGGDVTLQDVLDATFPQTGNHRDAIEAKYGQTFCQLVRSHFLSALGSISGATYEDTLRAYKEDQFVPDFANFSFTPKGGAIGGSKVRPITLGNTTVISEVHTAFTLFQLTEGERGNLRYRNVSIVVNGNRVEFPPKGNGADSVAKQAVVFETAMRNAGFSDQQLVQSVGYLNNNLFSFMSSMAICADSPTINIESTPAGMKVKITMPVVKSKGVEYVGLNKVNAKEYKLHRVATGQTFVHEILVQPDGSFVVTANGIKPENKDA